MYYVHTLYSVFFDLVCMSMICACVVPSPFPFRPFVGLTLLPCLWMIFDREYILVWSISILPTTLITSIYLRREPTTHPSLGRSMFVESIKMSAVCSKHFKEHFKILCVASFRPVSALVVAHILGRPTFHRARFWVPYIPSETIRWRTLRRCIRSCLRMPHLGTCNRRAHSCDRQRTRL